MITPTAEQQAIVDATRTGEPLVVEAGAGTGKTSTLRMVAAAAARRRGLYLAYNRAIKDDAARSFPHQVQCKTSHGLAFGPVATRYRHRLGGRRIPAHVAAGILGIREPVRLAVDQAPLAPQQLARIALAMVGRYCHSADDEIGRRHLPILAGVDEPATRAALAAAVLPYARKAWADLGDPAGQLHFTHDCQPPGTLVRRVLRRGGHHGSDFEDVPIEQIRKGDYVVSLTTTQRRGYVRRQGRLVNAVGGRDYTGDLVTVATSTGRQSSYTTEHRCVVRLDSDLTGGNHVVYLARRGDDYRIGRTTWRTRSQGNTLGVRRRAESQGADAIWLLSVHATDAEAALEEALVSHRWRLPTWQFRAPNETMPLSVFWSKAGNNTADARAALVAHGLDLRFPFWERSFGWQTTRRPVVLRALNLLPGMLVLEPDEITPGVRGDLRAHDGTNGWSPISVSRSRYEGEVYNLDVDVDHTYVADGIATRNCYLKMYQLSRPRLRFDFLLVDEAQDLNPVVKAIVEGQDHAQRIWVGDRCQAIYGWRGAVDAMAKAQGRRLFLSQSFRFGQPIADEANKWLTLLGAQLRLTGSGPASTVGPVDAPDAILTRSNATAMARVMSAVDDGRRAALVGGGGEIRALALAARDLQTGRGTSHPELLAFTSWHQVREYVDQDSSGSDLRVLVDLIERYGADVIVRVVDGLVDERYAELVVSTAHKAKGREWPAVRIAGDFREPKGDPDEAGELDPAEAMLAYVAVTRAKVQLDRAGLAWVDRWLPAGWQYRPDPVQRIAQVAAAVPEYVRPADPAALPVPERPVPPLADVTATGAPAAVRELQRVERLIESWEGPEPALRVMGWLADPVDPGQVEADIDAFMAASEPERSADRLAAGIVDSEVVAVEALPADRADRAAMLAGWPLCPGCDTHGQLLPDGLCASCSDWAGVAPAGDGEAVWFHHTGDPPTDPAAGQVVLIVPHCRRCGSDECICGPEQAAAYTARTGAPAGPRTAREDWARAQLAGVR